jgi:hypothetical protein
VAAAGHEDYATIGTAYAVLLSFVVVVVWGEFRDARETVARESMVIMGLFHLSGGFEASERREIRQRLVNYLTLVLDEEWPILAQAEESPRAWEAADDLWRFYTSQPITERDRPAYTESLAQMREFQEVRSRRLLDSHHVLPTVMWVLLIGGAIITISFTYLFAVDALSAQVLITSALTLVIVGALFLIAALDNPYDPNLRVTPVALENVQRLIAQRLLD